MVPTAGLEPAQVAPLAPQTSASTNFATSACPWASPISSWASPNSYGFAANPSTLRRCAPVRKTLSLNDYFLNDYFPSDYFAGAVGFGAAGAGAAGCVAAWAARSNTLVGSAVGRAPRYASVKLVAKNIAANTAVNFENKVL